MKHKTADLEGALLDAAVAKAEGRPLRLSPGDRLTVGPVGYIGADVCEEGYSPSTQWEVGGRIIQREVIGVLPFRTFTEGEEVPHRWCASAEVIEGLIDLNVPEYWSVGPTPLIAAMRAFVASKLGEEIELP